MAAFTMHEPVRDRAGAGARPGGDARRPSPAAAPSRTSSYVLQIKERQFVDAINAALGHRLHGDGAAPRAPSCRAGRSRRRAAVDRGAARSPIDVRLRSRSVAGRLSTVPRLGDVAGRRDAGQPPSAERDRDRATHLRGDDACRRALSRGRTSRAPSLADAATRSLDTRCASGRPPTPSLVAQRATASTVCRWRSPCRSRVANRSCRTATPCASWRSCRRSPSRVRRATRSCRSAARRASTVAVRVELVNNARRATDGQLALKMPAGWTSEPAVAPFAFARAGRAARPTGSPSRCRRIESRDYTIEAVATVDGRDYERATTSSSIAISRRATCIVRRRAAVRGVDVRSRRA